MSKLINVLLIFLLPFFVVAQKTLAIKNVNVINVKNGKIIKGQTVIIRENKIASVSSKINVPDHATVIDCTGKYLIPGLWDMHAHTLTDKRYVYTFPLLIANGVTGMREMASNLPIEEVNQIRKDVESGKMLGPRFGAITYHLINGGAPSGSGLSVAISSPDSARAIVRKYKQAGADFIKPYNLLSREVYLAIIDEAKKQKIPLEGHIPFSMSASEVSDLGQLVIEHNFGVLFSCSSNEKELRKQTQSQTVPWFWLQTETKAATSYDSSKAKTLFKQFGRNGTWSCPTLSFQKLLPMDSNSVVALAPYVPKTLLESWQAPYQAMLNNSLPQYRELRYEILKTIILNMYRAGVGILAGTDTGAFFYFSWV